MTQQTPKCLYCRKPIPKHTDKIRAPREAVGSMRPALGWEYTGNMIVVSRSYWAGLDEEKLRLDCVGVWDGESYAPRYRYFCTNTCAAMYGRDMAADIEAAGGELRQ